MGLILDTCVFIHAEKNRRVLDFNQWQAYGEVYISSMTVSELLVGVHMADIEARRIQRAAFVEAILMKMPVLDFTPDIARIHAELYASLRKTGQQIGAHDLVIAATALAHGYSLLTTNQQEFARVPGLSLLDHHL